MNVRFSLFLILGFALFLVAFKGYSQGMSPNWDKKIPLQSNGKTPYRAFQTGHNWLKPITGGLLYVYQQFVSEQIQADCVYETTCSEYMKQCLQTYGAGRGILSGLYQYSTCTGFEPLYHSDIDLNEHRKIKNNIDHEIW